MKKLVNPTTYFFEQADKAPEQPSPQIEKFARSLLNRDRCQLCRLPYDVQERIPRIMVHCGHTFCTPCLEEFYMNRRVRCPMCLKLVKQIDSLNRLPINHTVFTHLVQTTKKKSQVQNQTLATTDAGKYLYSEFQKVQKEAHRLQNPVKIDPVSGIPFCVFHPERVEHFYCKSHKSSGCRVCIEIGHSKPQCDVLDLYTVDDPEQYLNPNQAEEQNILQQRIEVGEGNFFGGFNPVPLKLLMKDLGEDQEDDGDRLLDQDDISDSVKSF